MLDMNRLDRRLRFSLIVSGGFTCAITPTLTQMLTDGTDLAPDFVQGQLRAALLYGLIAICTIGAEILAQLTLETPDIVVKDRLTRRLAKLLVHAILYGVAFAAAAGIYAAIRWQVVGSHLGRFAEGLPIFAAYSVILFAVIQMGPHISRSLGLRAYYEASKPS